MYFYSGSMNLKISTREFLRSLIMNPSSEFINSKWRIKYRWLKYKKLLDQDKIIWNKFYYKIYKIKLYISDIDIYSWYSSSDIDLLTRVDN